MEHKYPNIECCEYVIMPNHFHAIIKIDRDAFRAGEPRPYVVTLGHIVGYFKYQSTKMINLHGQKLWQRNYYEHIIQDEKAYHNISNYILNNPAQWAYDRLR
nr:transposase [Parabacteroides merdae]